MNRALKILLGILVVTTGAVGLLGPIYAIYVEKIGGGILEASSTYAIFALIYGSLIYFFGKVTDKIKESEYFLVAGLFLAALGFSGYLLVKNVVHLFTVQVVLGVAYAVMTPAQDSLYTEHLDKGRFASEWGAWEAVFYITEGISAFVGGMIVSYIGFSALFILMAAISAITGIYILFLPRNVL